MNGGIASRKCSAIGALVLALFTLAACSRERPPSPDSLTIAVPFELNTVDPHARDKLGSASVLSNIYESIVVSDPEMGIRPGLAVSWESPDPRTWIFHLRSPVKFHSGKQLKAADVVSSYLRILASGDLELRSYLLNVEAVKALDALTVSVRTKDPATILLNRLSHVPIIPDGSDTQSLGSAADGTGPYRLDSWSPGRSLRLTRFNNYWGNRPQMNTVVFVLGSSPDGAMRGLLSGEYQLIKTDSKKLATAVSGSSRFQLLRQDNLFVKYLGLNLSHRYFGVQKVRQAIHIAIDRRRLVRALSNHGEPASQLVPRFVFGFNPNIELANPDLERARRLLAEAGVSGEINAVLYARSITGEAASFVRDELLPLGIHLEVKVLPDADFFSLLQSEKADLWLNSAGCSTGDASDLFDTVVHTMDAQHRYGMQNFGRFVDPELDEAIQNSNGIEKLETRRNALQGIMTTVMEKLILIPLYNDQDVYAISRDFSWTPRADSYILAADIHANP